MIGLLMMNTLLLLLPQRQNLEVNLGRSAVNDELTFSTLTPIGTTHLA